MAMIAQLSQRINCTPTTRAKGKRLQVVDLTSRYAFVEGDTDVYQVWFSTLTCTCEAGQHGLRCSHAMAAIRERAAQHGRANCMFANSPAHLRSFAALQRAKGYEVAEHSEGSYCWLEWGSRRAPNYAGKSMAELQALVDELTS